MKLGILLLFCTNIFATNIGNELKNQDILQDNQAVQQIVDQVETVHNVKCNLKSATTFIGDHHLNFKCKSSQRKIKLTFRIDPKDEKSSIKNYKVIFRK